MRWSETDSGEMNFFDFMQRYVKEYSEAGDIARNCLGFDEEQLRSALGVLCEIDVPAYYRLSLRRLDFVITLALRRRDALLEALNSA